MLATQQPVVIDLTQKPPLVDEELRALIPPLNPEEYDGLVESIVKEGCRDPVLIWNNIIIDGHNRVKICTERNIPFKTAEMRFNSKDDVKIWMIDNQLSRRNLDKWDRLKLAEIRKPLIEAKARERMLSGKPDPVPNLAQGLHPCDRDSQIFHPGRTRDQIAEIVGVSKGTYDKMTIITEKKPELIVEIKAGKTSIDKVFSDIKLAERLEIIKSTPQNIPLPTGTFNVIYADPPWRYDFSKRAADSIDSHYQTMSTDEICDLQVPIEENAVLLLWTTVPHLPEALHVMAAWGFEYKSHAVWDKESIGLGYWFRGQHELLLLGIRGVFRTPAPMDRYSSVIRSKKTEHSKKPIVVYEMIERMFPNQKYLELFARSTRPRWSSWGNQV